MTRAQHGAVELFDGLQQRFGSNAGEIIKAIVEIAGGLQIRVPDLQFLYRQERNRRIRYEFTGFNYEELAIKYRLKCRQVRRIVSEQPFKQT